MVPVTIVFKLSKVFLRLLTKDCQLTNGKFIVFVLLPIVQNKILYSDIWLQAKTWVRRFCALVASFSHLKWLFEWFTRNTTFDFLKLQMYGVFSKIK